MSDVRNPYLAIGVMAITKEKVGMECNNWCMNILITGVRSC